MKKLIVLATLALFVGVIAVPAFASTEAIRIALINSDDDPKKNKEKKETTEKKETKETKDCNTNKDCTNKCPQTCKPTDCEHHKKVEEKK